MARTFRIRLLGLFLLSLQATPGIAGEKCSLRTALLNAIDRKGEKFAQVDPWDLPPELEKSLETYWKESKDPLETKLARTYEKILDARVAKLSPMSRALVKRAGRRMIERESWYFRTLKRIMEKHGGSHYNPVANRVYLSEKDGGKLTDIITAIHEMEHAIERNESLWSPLIEGGALAENMMLVPTPFGALEKLSSESRAIGAQWELMRHVPKEYHDEMRAALVEDARIRHSKKGKSEAAKEFETFRKNREKEKSLSAEEKEVLDIFEKAFNDFDERFDVHAQIDLKSLEHSHLPKSEFIRKMQEVHGYTLRNVLKEHYRIGLGKLAVLAFSGFGIYDAIEGHRNKRENLFQNGLKGVLFLDLKLYLFLVHESNRKEPPLTRDQIELLQELESAPK